MTKTLETTTHGIVTRTDGHLFWVDIAGSEIRCTMRGNLKHDRQYVSALIVAGDRVIVQLQPDGTGAIASLEPRQSELSRRVFFDRRFGEDHITAANLDLLVIVASAREPKFETGLVERFLALAHRGRMAAIIALNKCDLSDRHSLAADVESLRPYGAPILLTSAVSGQGVGELRELLRGRISCLSGRSGSGKSSLINAMYPGFDIKTKEVGARTAKGQHTTTSTRLYPLPDGGFLADTPGIKDLRLFDSDDAVSGAFADIVDLATGCRFSDCHHVSEPGCAVKAAVEAGDLPEARYRSYLKTAKHGK